MKLYNSIITTKNSILIPSFLSGKTMESRYNPLAEAEKRVINQSIDSQIVLILGIGSGLFIDKLSEKYSSTLFLCLENSIEDIFFLSQLDSFQKLKQKSNVIIFSVDQIKQILPAYYIPSFYGNIQIIEQRPWIDELGEKFYSIKQSINEAFEVIKADFSVQSHFGKIWQKNIISNLISINNFTHLNTPNINLFISESDLKKEAVIVAAGPTLDKTFKTINSQKFVISTDTALQSLIKRNIIPDIVISIDGQNISYNHFFFKNYNLRKTIFIFDICGNSKITKKLLTKNKCYFINTGHPLIQKLNLIEGNYIPYINAGAGTVTIAAFDLTLKLGFSKISVLGADFSYNNGKAYTRGTYLDSLYFSNSNKINTFENKFNKLQFRTELIKKQNNIFTTNILQAYKNTFEDELKKYNCSFNKINDIYKIQVKENLRSIYSFNQKICNFNQLLSNIENEFKTIENFTFLSCEKLSQMNFMALLPYVAYLRKEKKYSNYNINILLKLAFKNIVSYNELL